MRDARLTSLLLVAITTVACSGADSPSPDDPPVAVPSAPVEPVEPLATAPAAPSAEAGREDCDAGALHAELRVATLDELHRRNRVAQECRLFTVLIDITEEIARRDGRPAAVARYYHVVGVVYRDELSDPESAAQAFRYALDQDPSLTSVREALEALETPPPE